jgi:hypothetical protein
MPRCSEEGLKPYWQVGTRGENVKDFTDLKKG